MRKVFLILMAVLPLLCFTSCSDDESENLNNSQNYLSEIVVEEHEKKFGEISDYGELYEQYIYNQDGTLKEKTTNYYLAVWGDRVERNYRYEYDEKKRVVEMNEYELTLFQEKRKYEYNDIDSVSRMLVYGDDGDLKEEWTYEYDNQRRLTKTIEKIIWLSNFGYISEYRYDGNNVYVKKTKINDGSLFGNYIYEYDSYGNLLKETYINGEDGRESIEEMYRYEYDSVGRIQRKSKKEYIRDDWTYYDYIYNENGDIDKISISYTFKDDESELRYEYIYK